MLPFPLASNLTECVQVGSQYALMAHLSSFRIPLRIRFPTAVSFPKKMRNDDFAKFPYFEMLSNFVPRNVHPNGRVVPFKICVSL